MRLETELRCGLPRLAWLAAVDFRRNATVVLHGASVETTDRFVVEGVWEGAFSRGDFAESEAFFGSGLRVEAKSVIVSPSRALVDRVFSCEIEGGFLVANSLPLLLFATDTTTDPERSYQHETYTILKGIHEYDTSIGTRPASVGPFRQHYYHPFLLTADGIRTQGAPEAPYFGSYGPYFSFLQVTLGAVLKNSRDPERKAPFVPRLTLSRGYDSPAVAALASRLICPPAYTAVRSNSLLPAWFDREASTDDGETIASYLRLPVRYLEAGLAELDERLFLAGSTGDPEVVFAKVASDALHDPDPTLLLTGYHGDTVWARDPGSAHITPNLRRGDTSGLALSEVRLWAGFVNMAVPFLGARGIESIVQISRSTEMKRWSIGGVYDRPIPRRIVEEAGIPRACFGHRKRAVVQTYSLPATPALRPLFGRWLEASQGITLRRYRFLVRAGLARWGALRTGQKLGAARGRSLVEPTRWPWVPGGDPASLLYRWAVSELSGANSPFSPEIRKRVQALLTGVARRHPTRRVDLR